MSTPSTAFEVMDTKLKYFIYCRKSSEDEDRQILSIEAQLRELKDYAQKCELLIVHTFTESKSAHKPGRDIFNEVIQRIEMGEANALLVWQINRIARNAFDGGKVIWMMDEGKIKQIDTPHKQYRNNGDDKFFMTLEFGMAKKYSDDLSDNVKRGLRQKYERGEYPNYAPLGYLNVRTNGHCNIAPDPKIAKLVVKMITEYATGKYSLGQMVKVIASWGLKTRSDKPISKSHLQKILKNPIYYGWFWHGGELHKGNYETIITKQLYDKVQEVLHNKSKPKKLYQDWAYAQLLKCGCGCGSSIIFETKRKFYKGTSRWAEYTYARSSKRCGKCNQAGILLEELERQIKEKLDDIVIDKETWKLGIKLLEAKYEREAKERANIIANRQREYQRLQDELDGYFKMRAREEMSAEEFQEKKKFIISEQTKVKEKMDEGIHNQRHWLELSEDFLNTAFQAREMILSDDLQAKRTAVHKIGWNLLLKDKQLVWTYQKPYDVLLKPQARSNLRRGRDSNSRKPFGFTRSPNVPRKPLGYLS